MSNSNYLAHHGISGQKWGRKNGPPYPLNPAEDYSSAQKEANHVSSKKPQGDNGKSYVKEHASYRGDPKDSFKKSDYNKDGKTNLKDIGDKLSDTKRSIDKNHDGKVSGDELGKAYQKRAKNFGDYTKQFISESVHAVGERGWKDKMTELRSASKVGKVDKTTGAPSFNRGKTAEDYPNAYTVGENVYDASGPTDRDWLYDQMSQRGAKGFGKAFSDEAIKVSLGEKRLKDIDVKKIADKGINGIMYMPLAIAGEKIVSTNSKFMKKHTTLGLGLGIAGQESAIALGETAVDATLHPEHYQHTTRKDAYAKTAIKFGSVAIGSTAAVVINKHVRPKLKALRQQTVKSIVNKVRESKAVSKAIDTIGGSKTVGWLKKHPQAAAIMTMGALAVGATEYSLARGRQYAKKHQNETGKVNTSNRNHDTTPTYKNNTDGRLQNEKFNN